MFGLLLIWFACLGLGGVCLLALVVWVGCLWLVGCWSKFGAVVVSWRGDFRWFVGAM